MLKRLLSKLRKSSDTPTWLPVWSSWRPANWADYPAEQVRHYKHWVYSAVSAIAFRSGQAELRLHAHKGNDAEGKPVVERVYEHPFLDVIDRVNPFHTKFRLWSTTFTFLELTGNPYWYVVKNRLGTPVELWVVHSHFMRVLPDRKKFVAGDEYRRGTEVLRFDREEIVHLKYPNPESLFYGGGPLQAAEAFETHESIKEAELESFRDGAFPGLAIRSEEELSESAVERPRRSVEAFYSGPSKAGRVRIPERGLKAEPVTLSPREMDFLRSSTLSRDEILGIFKVPAAIARLSEDVNRSLAEAMDVIFAKYCIAPRLRMIEDQPQSRPATAL